MTRDQAPWNHNIHYHSVIMIAVPTGAQRTLDVGCGEGMMARRLRLVVPHVTGIDLHDASLELAQATGPADIDYVAGDFLTHPFEPESFDLVASIAAVHHLDTRMALRRMQQPVADAVATA